MPTPPKRADTKSRSRRPAERRPAERRPAERNVPGVAAHPEASGPLSALDAERAKNRRWPLLASSLFGVVLGLVVFVAVLFISLPVSLVLGVVVAIVAALVLRRIAPAKSIRAIGAVPAESGSMPRVETLLSGLSVTMGVTAPSLGVLVDEVPNAAIVGTRGSTTLVVTTGLLASLSVVELEGVLAHLLAHERLDAVERATTGAGIALLLGPLGRRAALAHRLTGAGRVYRADELAVLAVRYPPGLAGALGVMEQASLPEPGSLFASASFDTVRWLFVDPSITRRAAGDEVGDVDATGVRRRALEER